MKMIEWSMNNGVYEVKSFDDDTKIIEGFETDDLKESFEGTRGAMITDELFYQVKAEYGVS